MQNNQDPPPPYSKIPDDKSLTSSKNSENNVAKYNQANITKWTIRTPNLARPLDLVIKNEWNNDIYMAVSPKGFDSVASTVAFQLKDVRTGEEMVNLRQPVRFGIPKYEIFKGEILYATMKRKFAFLRRRLEVQTIDGHRIDIHEELTMAGRKYLLKRKEGSQASQVVATMERADLMSFAIEIQQVEDVAFILAICAVLSTFYGNVGAHNYGHQAPSSDVHHIDHERHMYLHSQMTQQHMQTHSHDQA